MANLIAFIIIVLVAAAAYAATRSWSIRDRARRRIYSREDERGVLTESAAAPGWLSRWLSLAGFRRRTAPALFVGCSVGALALGLAMGQIYRAILLGPLVETVSSLPGAMGQALAAILRGGPWIILAVVATVPTMVVRAARRTRVREIEQDLPLTLDLFATMAEAGLGFDAATSRIITSHRHSRPLRQELQNFQRDQLAGIPRVHALSRLARRVDVSSLTTFTSAVIQAEQVGAGMAETLRHQAEDLRSRRRESALVLAQSLPVKLVFPLVLCFLPGIFVSTLAPVIYQMIQVTNSVLRTGGR
jgi:pilus assembly protein TadC